MTILKTPPDANLFMCLCKFYRLSFCVKGVAIFYCPWIIEQITHVVSMHFQQNNTCSVNLYYLRLLILIWTTFFFYAESELDILWVQWFSKALYLEMKESTLHAPENNKGKRLIFRMSYYHETFFHWRLIVDEPSRTNLNCDIYCRETNQ